jgi:hypothetical protein
VGRPGFRGDTSGTDDGGDEPETAGTAGERAGGRSEAVGERAVRAPDVVGTDRL